MYYVLAYSKGCRYSDVTPQPLQFQSISRLKLHSWTFPLTNFDGTSYCGRPE